MIAWMLYCLAVSLLVAVAAASVETSLRALARPTRWAWMAALVGSLAVPAVALVPPAAPPVHAEPSTWIALDELNVAISGSAGANPSLAQVDILLRYGWLLASLITLLVLANSAVKLHRLRRNWQPAELEGTAVLLSRSTGPAVIGVLRSEIVVPAWVAGLTADARRLLLEHEREHLRAGDVRLLAAAMLMVAAMPWNPVLWWQLRRLRLAIEVDCDARVIRRHPGIGAYGSALIETGRLVSRGTFAMTAFAERRSTLERRIRIMTTPPPAHPLRRALVFATFALAGLAAACEVRAPTPLQPEMPPQGAPVQAVSPSIGDEPAFTPRTQEPRLEGDQRRFLMERLEGGFPADLRAADAEARVVVWAFIDEQGRTGNTRLVESSGNSQFDQLVQDALRAVTWTPARNRDVNVPVWVQLPIAYQVRGTAEAATPAPPAPPTAPRPGPGAERQEVSTAPAFTPRTQEPRLLDRDGFVQALRRYAAALEEPEIEGRAVLWVFVDAEGQVGNTRIVQSSGDARVDGVALAAIREARFEPARNRGEPVPVWIHLPVAVGRH